VITLRSVPAPHDRSQTRCVVPGGSGGALLPSPTVSRQPSSPQAAPRSHRTWPQRAFLAVNVVLVIACLGAAFGLTKVRTTLQSVSVVDVRSALSEPPEVVEPRNVLIIGTDSAAGLDKDDPITKGRSMAGDQRADVIMILRVDPRTGTARLLSIPRDSRIPLAPDGRMDRINAAIAGSNGARNLVQTIKRNFGIQVDNYAQVDFKSFQDLVKVLGSVPVHFSVPVRDRNTGLAVGEPGCVQLSPEQALAYARSRHLEFQGPNGRWRTDGSGDLGRITRQQDFIKRALRKASDAGLRNPSTAVGIVNAASSSVILDDTLTAGTILDLLQQFRSFNPDELQTVQLPTEFAPRGGVAYQDVLWDDAIPLLAPFWGVDDAVGVQPRDVIVDVRAPGDDRSAPGAVTALVAAGFDAEAVEARNRPADTTLSYGPAGRDAARLVARQLGGLPQPVLDEEIVGNRVVLTIGRDFDGVRATAIADTDLPGFFLPAPRPTDARGGAGGVDGAVEPAPGSDGSTSDDTVPAEGGDPSTEETSTTTTVVEDGAPPDLPPPGVLPIDPDAAAACR
jgi:polyisoprenyl-teichoic acid--peptidoglycan teichoic acid transferase